MFRKINLNDREKYLEMAQDFYASPAVLHPVPVAFIERTFEEMMRSEDYAVGYIIEAEEKTAGQPASKTDSSRFAGSAPRLSSAA